MSKSDIVLIENILAGDSFAFAALVDKHKGKAMTLAVRMLKNRQNAEEALQDAFIRVFRSLDKFERASSFSTWLYRIVFNVCATRLKQAEKQMNFFSDADDEEALLSVPADEATPDSAMEYDELEQIVSEEMSRLPAGYAGILTLFIVQEMSYEEIVNITSFPLGTVKTKIFRARQMLRERVKSRM